MTEIKTKIPAEMEPAAVGGMVTDSKYVKDRVKNKTQEQINSETEERVSTLEESVGTGGSVDERIAEEGAKHYLKTETYSKTELNNMITTPSQEYVSVTATAQTTAVTDVLPATGAADTTYRVGNWDGTQYNDSVFSEYAWNGSAYVKLSTKSQVGEVYDISANHAGATYADLSAALGTNGANIPQSLRKGGMSVKYVHTSDNKYVQYRLFANSFTTNVSDWSFCGDDVLMDNPEFIEVKTDSEYKLLEARKVDGTKVEYAGLEVQGNLTNKGLQEQLDSKVEKVAGKSLIDADFASSQSVIESPEWLNVTTDSEGRILEGTDVYGSKYISGLLYCKSLDILRSDINKLNKNICPSKDVKVLWIGTSIPEWKTSDTSTSYAVRACTELGWKVYNNSLGNSRIRVGTDNTFSNDTCGKNLAENTEEKIARYSETLNGPNSTAAEKERYQKMMDWGYDKLIIPYLDGTIDSCDLVVFDHGYNDRDAVAFKNYIDNFDSLDLSIDKEDSDYDRGNFIGAFCFLIKKILETKPSVKIAICSYLENKTGSLEFPDDVQNKCGYLLCKLQEKLARHFMFPFLDICNYNGFSLELMPNTSNYIADYNAQYGTNYYVRNYTGQTNPNNDITRFQYYCPDGTHPHTDYTLRSSDVLTQSAKKLLRDLL